MELAVLGRNTDSFGTDSRFAVSTQPDLVLTGLLIIALLVPGVSASMAEPAGGDTHQYTVDADGLVSDFGDPSVPIPPGTIHQHAAPRRRDWPAVTRSSRGCRRGRPDAGGVVLADGDPHATANAYPD